MAGSHAADDAAATSTTAATEESASEPVGASPGESISDATEEPHTVTTPDAPADTVDVSDVEDPKAP